jgi:ATP-binding cassette subfamily B protein
MTSNSTLQLLARLWHHLSRRRQRQLGIVVILTFLSALAEMVSLGAVLPFVGVLIAPQKVFSYPAISHLIQTWGITSPAQLVAPLTIAFIVAVLLSALFRIFHCWVSTRVAYASGADLSSEVYYRTLHQPYQVHVARNTSSLISNLTKVEATIDSIFQVLTLLSSVVLLIAVTVALLLIDPFVAITSMTGFAFIYLLITRTSRQRLRQNSQRIARERTQAIKTLQEGLGGIRDILLDGTQSLYCKLYDQADRSLQYARGNNIYIAISPRFIVEGLGMTLIAVIAYTISHGEVATGIPALAALALGAQRLLPALQQGYNAWANILGNRSSMGDVLTFLNQPVQKHLQHTPTAPLPFTQQFQCDNLRFRYSDNGPWVLDGVDLTIPKGSRIGFVGSTGSGKSTLLDIVMGLLAPTTGRLLVDGTPVNDSCIRAWQQNIAHVPQSIYLADTTIAENIAFGVPANAIDMERVKKAAQQAQIADHIENQPNGYQATIGERGVQLSGGQRQRIGIARAFYKNASILIFDEATSALDNLTEKSVMASIENLDRACTVLVIAHRLTTIQGCDTIVELSHGKIVAQGSYEELLTKSPSFQKIASIK